MQVLDASTNVRLPVLVQLMHAMSSAADAPDLLRTFVDGMRQIYGASCYLQVSTVNLPPGHFRIVRFIFEDGTEPFPTRGLTTEQGPIFSGGIVAEAMSAGEPGIYQDVELSEDVALGNVLASYRAMMAAPLITPRGISGWALIFERDPDKFDMARLEQLLMRVNLIGAAVDRLQASQALEAAKRQIDKEIHNIANIQRTLLPEGTPMIPGLELAASYATFDQPGGDIYDFFPLGSAIPSHPLCVPRRWAILIGDASGHGPAAAVVMAMVHAILHAYPTDPLGPGELLHHLNVQLCAKRIDASFVTAFIAFYDTQTRELVYARAGHNPPILKSFPDGEVQRLDEVGDLPLGIDPDAVYEHARVTLHPGQTLVFYTDGITEALKPGGEMFGIEGIEASLIHCSGTPDCAIRHITEALVEHQQGLRPRDDQTVIAVQVV